MHTLSAVFAPNRPGWILLALCVALVNAGSGLNSLYILLCCFGFLLFLLFAVKPALVWILRRSGSIEHGPSQSIISLILLIALASAFFTGVIGVHPIFGGFMAGLIVPREERFNIRVTEKLEDLIGAVFLPLYFTLSGLSTNLGLLDTGTAWGYVFATTFAALLSKIIGASLAARFNGLVWRESFTIGVLMSCKGLVELIVLNIGLQAKILSTRTFTIFVVMALLTTFMTTPVVSVLYPPWYQKKIEAWKRGEIDWDTGAPITSTAQPPSDAKNQGPTEQKVKRLLVYLRLDNMPSLLQLLSMFGDPSATEAPAEIEDSSAKAVWAHGIRLLQLTDRDSSVMTVSQVQDYSRHDPVVNTFRTVGKLHNLASSGEVAIMPETRFAGALAAKASRMLSDLLLVPWSETGAMGDSQVLSGASVDDKLGSTYRSFVKSVLDTRDQNTAVFFSRTSGAAESDAKGKNVRLTRMYSFGALKEDMPVAPLINRPYHIFMIYLGGEDDALALRLVLQLCEKSKATATILNASTGASSSSNQVIDVASASLPAEMASRVKFDTPTGNSHPSTDELVDQATAETTSNASDAKASPKLIVVGRRDGLMVDDAEKPTPVREDLKACLGHLAGCIVAGGVRADMLVVQAKTRAE